MTERLHKILSACGVASRREAEIMIRDGRVRVNGSVATVGQSARAGIDEITLDGAPVEPRGELVYIMLNKPRGYITTVSDDRGRKTVMDLVRDAGTRVYPVGRLDRDTEGLLLLTNDGDFANAVAHPSYNKIKTYHARVLGDADAAVSALRGRMVIDSRAVTAASVEVLEQSGGRALLSVSVTEGRNRQIRKMCELCGLDVRRLKRVSVGALELGSLEPGHWRHLTAGEVNSLI